MSTKKKSTKKASKKSTKKTYVVIVLDKSGSMTNIHQSTVNGVNEQFDILRKMGKQGGDTEVTLIEFDTTVETKFSGVKPENLKKFANEDFRPQGGTAMYNAIWEAISQLQTKSATEDTGFLVCVISDGDENSSYCYAPFIKENQLSTKIAELQSTGKWTFTYMLANVDVKKYQSALHITNNNVRSYVSNNVGTAAAYTVQSSAMGSYLKSRALGATATADFYSGTSIDISSPAGGSSIGTAAGLTFSSGSLTFSGINPTITTGKTIV